MNKWVLIAIGVVGIGTVLFFVSNQNTTKNAQPTPTTATEQPKTTGKEEKTSTESTVTYTEDGFSPETLTVKSGTTVTFKNESGKQMWVASNPHPIHTDHSAFDQKTTGDTYTFTFEEKDEYKYHNHLSPFKGGKIVVE